MSVQADIHLAVGQLITEGIYPSPGNIRVRLGRTRFPQNLNGHECKWREEAFKIYDWERKPNGVEGDKRRKWGPK